MLTVASIKQAVAQAHGIPVDALSGKSRLGPFVAARQEAMFLCRRLIRVRLTTGRQHNRISLEMIGRRFGGRHHTTVMSAIKLAESRRASDPRLRIRMRCMALDARRDVDSLSVGLLLR